MGGRRRGPYLPLLRALLLLLRRLFPAHIWLLHLLFAVAYPAAPSLAAARPNIGITNDKRHSQHFLLLLKYREWNNPHGVPAANRRSWPVLHLTLNHNEHPEKLQQGLLVINADWLLVEKRCTFGGKVHGTFGGKVYATHCQISLNFKESEDSAFCVRLEDGWQWLY